MTLPTWPSQVDSGARDGWQMSDPYIAPLATEMNGGNRRQRSQPGSNVATISYPLKPMDATAWGYFETFFRTTLNNGASRFTMDVTLPSGSVNKTAQFDRAPNVSISGGFRHVTLSLRVFGM